MNQPRNSTRQAGGQESGYPAAARRLALPFAILFALVLSDIAAADGNARIPSAVWAIGLPNGYVIMEHQAQTLQVTPDDVERGVLDVRDGSRLIITTTTAAGYTVDFHTRGDLFQAVQIDGISGPVALGPKGGTVVESNAVAGRRVVTVNYRFALSPNTTPGVYAWPLTMIVRGPTPGDLALAVGMRRNAAGEAPHGARDRTAAVLGGRREP